MNTSTASSFGLQLGQAVKRLRQRKNITQEELRESANLSSGYISKLEQGEFESPSIASVFAIANALGMSLRDLLEDAGLITPESTFEGTLRAEGANEKQIEQIKEMKNFVLYSNK